MDCAQKRPRISSLIRGVIIYSCKYTGFWQILHYWEEKRKRQVQTAELLRFFWSFSQASLGKNPKSQCFSCLWSCTGTHQQFPRKADIAFSRLLYLAGCSHVVLCRLTGAYVRASCECSLLKSHSIGSSLLYI